MTTKRERKHRRIEMSGQVTVDEPLPRWEAELVIAALARLQSARPGAPEAGPEFLIAEEVADAAR